MQNFNENNDSQRTPEEFKKNIDAHLQQQQQVGTYFCKTEFRNMLVSMSKSERIQYESTLSEEFKKSSKMPSVKKLSTLVLLALLPLFLPIAINRLYAGRMVTGIIRLILPLTSILIWIIWGAVALASKANPQQITMVSDPSVTSSVLLTIASLSIVVSYIWTIVDLIRSILGRQKDKYGRAIDL